MGETMADLAANASSYKEGIEQQYREKDAALNQQQAQIEQQKAQAIAQAAGQIGSAVSGLVVGGMDMAPDAGNSEFTEQQSEFQKSFKPTLETPDMYSSVTKQKK
jgi:hypothetical protein